ncbi:MAG: hypothetical protein H6R15_3118 [Proteobacteria bacterium]|nr:hypothetical protein [Pseudomonadota bacterium]
MCATNYDRRESIEGAHLGINIMRRSNYKLGHQQSMQKSDKKIVEQTDLSLLEELTGAFEQGRTIRLLNGDLTLLEALQSDDTHTSSMASLQMYNLIGNRLTKRLVQDQRFPGNRTKMIRTDNGGCGFYPAFVALPLLRRALRTGSPEDAIAWLQEVLSTTVATGKTIDALWGVPVEQEIPLTEGIKLVPIDNLPESKNKQWMMGAEFSNLSSPIITTLSFTPPQSALVVTRKIDPFLFDPDLGTELTNDEYLKTHELIKEIVLVLTVVGPRVAISAAQWFTFDDPDLEEANILSGGRSMQMLEILPLGAKDYPTLNCAEAQEMVAGYINLTGDNRSKVRVALQRLNQALRRHNTGDSAVELATGLEALFGDSDNSEMTHKIRMRTARVIGGAQQERIKNAQLIKRMYEIRSKLVHTGHVDLNKTFKIGEQSMTARDIVDQAVQICAQAIKTIIRRGSIPNWSVFDILEHPDSPVFQAQG